jgi:hypothetical protein
MKKNIIEEYAGWTVTFDKNAGEFIATARANEGEDDVREVRADTIKSVRAKIETANKEPRIKQPKQDALEVRNRQHEYTTSEKHVGAFGYVKRWYSSSDKTLYAWVTDRNGRNRERNEMGERYGNVLYIEDTPANRATLKQLTEKGDALEKIIEEVSKEQAKLRATLTRVQPKIELGLLPTWDK